MKDILTFLKEAIFLGYFSQKIATNRRRQNFGKSGLAATVLPTSFNHMKMPNWHWRISIMLIK